MKTDQPGDIHGRVTAEQRATIHNWVDRAIDTINVFDPARDDACPTGKDAAMRAALKALCLLAEALRLAMNHVFGVATQPNVVEASTDADCHHWERVHDELEFPDLIAMRSPMVKTMLEVPGIFSFQSAFMEALLTADRGASPKLFAPVKTGKSGRPVGLIEEAVLHDCGVFYYICIGYSGKKIGKGGQREAIELCMDTFQVSSETIVAQKMTKTGWSARVGKEESEYAIQFGRLLSRVQDTVEPEVVAWVRRRWWYEDELSFESLQETIFNNYNTLRNF